MTKLAWCLKEKKGIELIEPNENLSNQYLKEAKQTLLRVQENKDKWDIIMGYYACYNALYSLLMKAGIKCEIHDCTIELIKLIDGFDNADYLFLSDLKELRTQVQYYLKEEVLKDVSKIKGFVMKCGESREQLDVNKLRGRVNEEN
jgi:uncharacterized protein (UPF0332 family)